MDTTAGAAEEAIRQLPRVEEIQTFLRLAECVDALGPDEANVKRLIEVADVGHYSTVLGRLKGLLDFLFNDTFPDNSLTPEARLRLLFTPTGQSRLALTPFGLELRDRLIALQSSCAHLQRTAQTAWGSDETTSHRVSIGAPQMIATRLLASALSDTTGLLDPTQRAALDVTIGNSRRDLIPKLYLGQLAFVVGYGPPGSAESERVPKDKDVQFVSLDYRLRMVCVCHPHAQLSLRAGKNKDPNAGYWDERMERTKTKGVRRAVKTAWELPEPEGYDSLRTIDPHLIDFRRTPLIVVPSWRQREGMEMVEDAARRHNKYREVTWYDESLAYVRMNAGIAFVPEVYVRRKRVNAFRLEGADEYTREVGFYYNRQRGLSPQAVRVLEFLRAYFTTYGSPAGGGIATEPPALGYKGYPGEIAKTFDPTQDFAAKAAELYPPTPPAPSDQFLGSTGRGRRRGRPSAPRH